MTKLSGKVFLIGAGPGNPELLTVKAQKILNEVDVVAYDSLISPALLMSVNPKAQLIHVGRRGYQKKIRPDLHPSVIQKAKEGKTVARLKSGDPMIFGKASEECKELIKANIPFEIIPGITSALGAASSCALPLTEKGSSSEVLFLNGHKLFGAKGQIYSSFEGTLVFYMGKKNLPQHCKRIIELGKDPKTPALFIEGATTIEQLVICGDLKTLPNKVREEAGDAPALFMVGKVLKNYPYLKEKGQFSRPLSHTRILLLRSEPGPTELADSLKDLGAEVFEVPKITSHFFSTYASLLKEKKKNSLKSFNLIFPTKESVFGFKNLLKDSLLDIRSFFSDVWVGLNTEAKEAIHEWGIKADLCSNPTLESLHFTSLHKNLPHKGTSIPCYHNESHFPQFGPPHFDLIIATSSASLTIFKESSWKKALDSSKVLTMDSSFLKKEGLSQFFMAKESLTISSPLKRVP